MSSIVKNSKGLLGLTAFVVVFWAVIVVTYARQVKADGAKLGDLRPLTSESCGSSSTSTSGHSSGGPMEP